jgi:hypothetical protein
VLRLGLREAQQPRRRPDGQYQEARRHGIERAGVTDFALAENSTNFGDHVVTG